MATTCNFIEWKCGNYIRKNLKGEIEFKILFRHIPLYLREHPDDPDAGLLRRIYEIELKIIKPNMRPTAGHIRTIFTTEDNEGLWLTTTIAYGNGDNPIKEFNSTLITSPEDLWEHVLADTERAFFADHICDDNLSEKYRRLWIETLYAKKETQGALYDDKDREKVLADIRQGTFLDDVMACIKKQAA